jgi:hypothetical protein
MARSLAFMIEQWGRPQRSDHLAKGLADFDFRSLRRLERTRLLVRAGPALGLMGTLIPLSPALEGLANGDTEELSDNLRVAFSVTVIGLLIGAVAFAISLVRDRLYGQDLSDLEFVAATIAPDAGLGAAGAVPPSAGARPAAAPPPPRPGAAVPAGNKPPPPANAKPLGTDLPPPGGAPAKPAGAPAAPATPAAPGTPGAPATSGTGATRTVAGWGHASGADAGRRLVDRGRTACPSAAAGGRPASTADTRSAAESAAAARACAAAPAADTGAADAAASADAARRQADAGPESAAG